AGAERHRLRSAGPAGARGPGAAAERIGPVNEQRSRPEAADPSVVIDLSRRKSRTREIVRDSVVAAAHGAAPYLTGGRIALAQLGRSRLARFGSLVLVALALVAIFADLLASTLPLACRWHGALYVLPNIVHPQALAGVDRAQMDRARAPG